MIIKYKKPSAILAPFVEHFWEKHNPKNQEICYDTETILPETYLNLTFSLGSSYFRSLDKNNDFTELNTPQLEGLHTEKSFFKHQSDNHIFGIKFLPGGLYPFVEHDFTEITNITLDMELIMGIEVKNMTDYLHHLPDFESRTEFFESFLLKKLNQKRLFRYTFVHQASQLLSHNEADTDISKVAEKLNTNYKTLSRAFNEVVGVAPKQFAQMRRFERALAFLSTDTGMNCTDIGIQAGYYDQAHFIREFKKWAHQTPSEYRESISPAKPDTERTHFLQFISPEHLLFYDLEVY